MSERQSYNTRARQAILECLHQRRENAVSAADIMDCLKKKGISVNSATVYRCLGRLCEERLLLKFTEDDGQKAVYQLAQQDHGCDGHLHIQCVKCGRLSHLDCDFMSDIRSHLENQHRFDLKCENSILYGVCHLCRQNGAQSLSPPPKND